jgi:hypothetical protein
VAPDPKQPVPHIDAKDFGPITRPNTGDGWENAGEGIAIIDDFLEKKFPNSGKVGYLGKAWGVIELIGFLRSGGRENRGDAAALAAEFVADFLKKQGQKAALAGASRAGYLLAEGVVVAWTTWEAFKLGAYIRSRIDGEPSEREQMYQKWEVYLFEHLWNPIQLETRDLRESAFDQLAGDAASHGVSPSLTVEASKELQRLKNYRARRVLDALQRVRELEPRTVTLFSTGLPGQTIEKTYAGTPKERAEAARELEVELATGIKEVIEFETNHLNWNLTKEQLALLPEDAQGYYALRDSNPDDGPEYGPQPRPR